MGLARTGCCNEHVGPDFSKMDLKKLDSWCLALHVDWCESNLWFCMVAIFCLPLFYAMMHNAEWCPVPFPSNAVFVQFVAFVLNIFKSFKFLIMTTKQPLWEALQNDWVVFMGYQLMGAGVLLYLLCLGAYGPYNTLFFVDLKAAYVVQAVTPTQHSRPSLLSPSDHRLTIPTPQYYRDLNRVLKAAGFCFHLGYSLIVASQAGILVIMLQGFAHSCGVTCF